MGHIIHSENHKNLLVRISFCPGTRFMFQGRIIAQPTSLMTLKNKNWVHQFGYKHTFTVVLKVLQSLYLTKAY